MVALSPSTLVAAYDYLRTTPPFNKWRLPDSDDVEFTVSAARDCFGEYQYIYPPPLVQHAIYVSSYKNKTHKTVLETMAHEMIHLHQRKSAHRYGTRDLKHGKIFQRHAAQVCRAHGFDPESF